MLPAILAFITVLGFALQPMQGATCPPTFNPNSDFVTNFNNACYTVTMATGGGSQQSGDPNATYDQMYYQILPGYENEYELVVLGTFPNARFMSATAYDNHVATTAMLIDQNILPLNSSMHNPFIDGATYAPKQHYGITVSFGGKLTSTPSAGCSASDTTIDQNVLDASQIHQGLSWNGSPYVPPGFPVHVTGANGGGIVMIRKYLDIANTPPEVVLVRSLSTGCAVLASTVAGLNIIGAHQSLSSTWLNQQQIGGHRQFSDGVAGANPLHPNLCFAPDPENALQWFRTSNYQPVADSVSDDIYTTITASQLQTLIAGGDFIQFQFPYPVVPSIPCATGTCTLTGNENLRYLSFAVQGPGGTSNRLTLATVPDTAFVKDPHGNVTLVVGLGATPPATLTALNGYTYLDLTGNPNISQVERFYIRNILPSASFACSDASVPAYTMEYNPLGGYMGANVPTVTYLTAAQIPPVPALPPYRPNSCTLIPPAPTPCTN